MDYYLCDYCASSYRGDEEGIRTSGCPECGGSLSRLEDPSQAEPRRLPAITRDAAAAEAKPVTLRFKFTGTASEYFRIWVVNTFLTIVTLGIYSAWATVRNRKYFYRNTILDGHSFDYTAKPANILKGYLIIGGGFLAYNIYQTVNPSVALTILVMFYLLLPVLIYKALRFFAYNSVYRNLRLHFHGSLAESYLLYLFYGVLVVATLGLIVPYWIYRRKKYFFGNMSFGSVKSSFNGRPGGFYKLYFVIGLLLLVLMFAGGVFIAGMASSFVPDRETIEQSGEPPIEQPGEQSVEQPGEQPVERIGEKISTRFVLIMGVFYGIFLLVTVFVQQYIYAWQTNYCLSQSELGSLRFRSTLGPGRLFWIRLSNIIAIIFSLGLLIPWAKVRRTRYVLDNVAVIAPGGLDSFTAASGRDESAYGEVATDFFDFEIGL